MREELLATLTALADFSYGWGLLDPYLPRLQAAVSITSMLLGHRMVASQGWRMLLWPAVTSSYSSHP